MEINLNPRDDERTLKSLNLRIDLGITGAVAGTIFNLSNNLCWHSLDAIWIFSFDKWIGARAALGATYCWNAVDAKK